MRTYRLMLSPNHALEINTSWIDKLRRGDLNPVYRIISAVVMTVLLGGAALFPLLSGWTNPDRGYTTYLIAIVSFLVAALVAMCILVGGRRLSDPPLFMPALIFVFMVLIALLFAPANPANTFGPDNAKYLGGLWVMSLLALYYMITVFVNSGKKLRMARGALFFGLFFSVIWLILSNDTSSNLIPLIIIAIPAMAVFAIQTRSTWISILAAVCTILGLVWALHLMVSVEEMLAVLGGIIVTGITFLAVNNWKLKFDRTKLLADAKATLRRKAGIRTTAKRNIFTLLMVGGLVWLVILIVWMLVNHFDLGSMLSNIGQNYINAADSLTDIKSMLVGGGVTSANNLSMLAAIIRYQGLVGLFAYIILGLSGFYLVLQNFANEAKQGGRFWWSLSLGLIVFTIPLYSVLALPGMVLSIVWWVAVGLLAAKLMWDKQGIRMYTLNTTFTFRGLVLTKYLPWAQLAAVIVIFAAWVYVLSIVAGLALQGVI